MTDLLTYLHEPQWRRQVKWRRAIWQAASRFGLTGMHALPMSRRWVDISRQPMFFDRLDSAFEGFKIVQLSDLHYSPVVWRRYLNQYIQWVNDLHPDLVVVTGDLITGGYHYARQVAALLSRLQAAHGVICTFGNHDYSIYGRNVRHEGNRRADYLAQCLRQRGLVVLRNDAYRVNLSNSRHPLMVVGLDDEWSGHIDPHTAFHRVDPAQPVICLNHNPANVKDLMSYPWQWMLSGHTHGRQVATSQLGRRLYPHRYRHYTRGHYRVEGRDLYVNRGLSYGQRMLDWCRPEVTVFRLTGRKSSGAAYYNDSPPSCSAFQ